MIENTRRYLSTYSFQWALTLCLALSVGDVLAQNATLVPTRGKRFWTGFMQNGFGAQSLKLQVISSAPTSGTVSMPLNGWTVDFSTGPGNVALIDVPTSAENTGSGNITHRGVLVQSQDSVNVFISSYQNYTHDLTQVLPESALGNTYRVDSYQGLPNFNNLHKSELLVVATQDGTQVRITPSVNTLSGNSAGVPFLVDLDQGQAYQLQAATDVLDLTGTLIEATAQSGTCRPFVVMGGSMCATAPGGCQACDAIFEQLVPVTAWGTRYYTAPIHGVNTSTFRILAHTDGTTVTIDGGSPINLNAGQRHEVNGSTTPACIQSDRPVSVIQLLEGYSCAGNGDPSLLLVSPADRLSTSATLNTPTSPQLSQHSIGVVVPLAAVGQLTLDGTVVNPSLFQPYPGCADRRHAKITVPAGVHRLQAAAGFQAYMFGVGYGESYAASVHDIRTVPIQQDSVICGSGPLTLHAPEPLTNAIWTEADAPGTVLATGNSYSFTPTSSGSYSVSGLLPISGCTRSFTYHIGFPLTIPTLLTANDQSTINVCQYEPVQLALIPPPDPAWFDIEWSPAYSLDDGSIADPVATPMGTTWYRVAVTSPSGCGNMVDSIRVDVTPAGILDLSTSGQPAAICQGGTVQLESQALRVIASDLFDGAPGSMWTAIQGGTVGTECGSHHGTALYFNGSGQRYAQTIGYNTTGGGQLRFRLKIADGMAPCDDADPGENVVLEYSNNNGLNWNPIATYNEHDFPSFEAVQEEIPVVAQTPSTMFRLRQVAHSGTGQDNWSVDEFLVSRYDNDWLSYSWSQPGTLNNSAIAAPFATPTNSGWYVLSATDPTAGCIYRDSVWVEVQPAFSIDVTPDMTLCAVTGVTINATPTTGPGVTYQWMPDNGTLNSTTLQSPTATPTATTTYSVTATTPIGCTATGQVTITVGQLLGFEVSVNDDTLCQGQSTQLNALATGGDDLSYAWTGNGLSDPSVPDPIATPTQTTTYSCTVTHNPSGCTLVQAVTVVVNTGYSANAGEDLSLCATLGHQLGVQHNVPNASYQWAPAANLNSSTIQSPSIMNEGGATFTVTVTDPNGCSVSDEVTITRAFDGVPASSSASGCANTPPTITAPANGVAYLWSSGQDTQSIVPTSSGPHTVTVTSAEGCEHSTTFNVVLFAPPIVDLGPDVVLCGATEHLLDAGNPGSTYLWNTNSNSQGISVASSGNYAVTVTDANGCFASDAINVQFNNSPLDVLEDISACASETVLLDAGNPGSTYLWNTGATTSTIVPSTSGPYSVNVTNAQGCSATFDAQVELAPLVTVDLGPDTTICMGDELVLDIEQIGMTSSWSTGSTASSITVTTGGAYSVVVSNGACEATDEIVVSTQDAPSDVLQDVTECIGGSVVLDAGNPGSTFLWNGGSTASTLTVTENGTYSVTVTNPTGCVSTFDAVVSFIAPPTVALGADTVLCDGEALDLDAGNPGATYLWSTGATSRGIAVREAGTYRVEADNGYCQRSDEIVVAFNPSPVGMATKQFHTCLGEDEQYVRLDAGNPGSRYNWSTGESARVILAGAYGVYVVEINNQYDCALVDSAQVIEHCPSAIFIPNTFTPNGDGTNDVFIPVGKNIATMHFYVFDRWGNMLFESDDPTMGWDGTYAGEVVQNDMYVWRLRYRFTEGTEGELGREHEQLGHIQVLR
ncbi:MAG: gliding motility-associated C-terminal domain-containing protein [Flavobacteriales bacterium]|nr:gliding motility-associated C-terminal domain-containing protein [Flavobacteriales bacterium]